MVDFDFAFGLFDFDIEFGDGLAEFLFEVGDDLVVEGDDGVGKAKTIRVRFFGTGVTHEVYN